MMPDQPTYRPVHKALHRPLTVCGVDRRLFFLALLMGGATFNLFYSFWSGVLVFVGLYGFALWASSGSRRRYDPGKHERFDVEVVAW
jgi:type IV secretory pathway TrbD component